MVINGDSDIYVSLPILLPLCFLLLCLYYRPHM